MRDRLLSCLYYKLAYGFDMALVVSVVLFKLKHTSTVININLSGLDVDPSIFTSLIC